MHDVMRQFFLPALFFLLLGIVALAPAYASSISDLSCSGCIQITDDETKQMYLELLPIVIWTDRVSYDHNSQIIIDGQSNTPNSKVTLEIFDSSDSIVYAKQLVTSSDGILQKTIDVDEFLTYDGSYIIQAFLSDSNDFKIFKTQILILPYSGSEFIIDYDITGGVITEIFPDVDSSSLIISLNSHSDGVLTLYLPREIIDSNSILSDDVLVDEDFFVLVDGEDLDLAMTKNSMPVGTYFEQRFDDRRILTIPFSYGDEEIEVIGTSVIPEFGLLVILILGVSVLSCVIMSKKSYLSFDSNSL